ncbi:MAG TPA: DNA ligase D [Lacipirellulaceae bacterium]|nr:DNA ligase D [Lacipirellulaceae bacterium]
MSLREYKRKRNFKRTSEPAGRESSRAGNSFVIQKHDASRLHYDFRLELDGTLKSWAVPKGPSLDPQVKSLAVHVEDHPLDYASFEGVIPEGEYGGGTVMVWDRGVWEPETEATRAYREGKLKFRLEGEKLHGSWALVRMGGRAGEDGKNWLLIKHNDDAAKPLKKYDVLRREPLSVLSGRDLPEIAADADAVWSSNRRANGKAHDQARRSGGKGGAGKGVAGTAVKAAARTVAAKAPPRAMAKPARKTAADRGTSAAASSNLKVLTAAALAKLPGARKRRPPASFKPQLATLASEVPQGDGWLHELKFDGYRILAHAKDGRVRLVSRNGKDWTHRFPGIAAAVAALPAKQALYDGEVVALNDAGISDFQKLQNALKGGEDAALVYYVFDLPYVEGYDLTAVPLAERKQALAPLVLKNHPDNAGVVRYSDHVEGHGTQVLDRACDSVMEGIVAKRADAPYEQARSGSWLKVKCIKRQEFVIVGYTKPSGARVGLGALLLAYYQGGELTYAGRVGTGFTEQSLRQLVKELKTRRVPQSPLAGALTAAQRRDVTWVEPDLVGEVVFSEWTDDGLLRHPSFQGLREDKPARQIVREEAMPTTRNAKNAPRDGAAKASSPAKARGAAKAKAPPKSAAKPARSARAGSGDATVAGVRISHPDRVLYPESGVTKLDLAKYYESVADWILPHIENRPLTLVRCPEGRSSECFYQKHLSGAPPEGIGVVKVKEKNGYEEYPIVQTLSGLVSLVQMGALELHPWPARADNVEAPDRLIFDFDPGEDVAWKAVVDAARDVRDRLAELGLESFLRTSGGKGLHVVAPLARRNSWEELKQFAHDVADDMVRRAPDRYIATMSKAKRVGKIFVDYLRNQRGATAVASYSTRARERAPVSVPVEWDELSTRLKPNGYTVANVGRRLASLEHDPWAAMLTTRQSITRSMQAEVRRQA